MPDPLERHRPLEGAGDPPAGHRQLSRLPVPPRWLFALAAAAEIVVLWTLSETPGRDVAAELPGPSGNLLHVFAYGVLATLLLRAWVPLRAGWRAPGAWPGIGSPTGRVILVLVALAGVMDEIHQFFIPGRTCSVLDVVADVLGAVVVLTWPGSDAGRPRTPRPAILALAGGVAIALIGWLDRPFPDRVLENVLDAVFGS